MKSVAQLCAGLLVLVSSSLPLVADDGSPAATLPTEDIRGLMDMSLEDLLQTPVYAASKKEQNRSDIPAFVTVITGEDIQRFGYRTLTDVIASVGPFYQSNDRNYRALGTRGFSRPGDYNARVLVLINGHRMNDPLFDSAVPLSSPDMGIDLDLIDRIEIIRGPGSSVYGTSAMFAVINVITRTGKDMDGSEASVAYGSFDTWSGRFSYGGILSNGVDVLVSGGIGEQGGQELYYGQYDSPSMNNGVTDEDADSGESMNTYIRMAAESWSLQFGYSEHVDYIPTASYGTVFGVDDTFTEDTFVYVDFTRDLTFSPSLTGMFRLGYDEYTYQGDYVYDYSEFQDMSWLAVNKDDVLGEWWTGEFQLRYDGIEQHALMAGTEYRLNSSMDYLNYDEGYRDEPYFDLSVDSWVWATYAQDDITLSDWAQVTVGARFDQYDLGGDAVSPRTGVILGPFDGSTIKLMYGEAFRAPNVYETSWTFDGQQAVNPDLDPETIQTYEILLEQKVGQNVMLNASLFQYDMTDLIGLVEQADGIVIYENIAESEARGVELEGITRCQNGMETRVSYTYTDAEDSETGEHLTNSPENLAKLQAGIPVLSRKLFAGAEVQYIGERLNSYRETVEDYCVANLTLSSLRLWKDVDCSFSVYNLFDTTYADPAYQQHVQSEIEQDGRSYRAKLTYRF